MILELNDKNYEEFIEKNTKPVFIDFYSPNCGPCQVLLKQLDYLENYGKDDIVIAKVDVSVNSKLAVKYQIKSVPMCCTIDTDKNVKEVCIGLDGDKYLSMIDKVLNRKRDSFLSRLFS
jgi:thioredoxin-like negative regulator of GroEL